MPRPLDHSRLTRRHTLVLTGAAACLMLSPSLRAAGAPRVQALNRHPDDPRQMVVFHPAITRFAPGESVDFVISDRGHNVECFPDMLPEGSMPFRSSIGEGLMPRFDMPGTYGFLCRPHRGMDMIGLVLVGEDFAANLDAVRAAGDGLAPRPLAERFAAQLAVIQAMEAS